MSDIMLSLSPDRYPLSQGGLYGYVPGSAGETGPLRGLTDPEKEKEEKEEKEKKGIQDPTEECQTCKNRKYKDKSNEMVSFKSPAHLSPENAASAVRAHEQEHVPHLYCRRHHTYTDQVLQRGQSVPKEPEISRQGQIQRNEPGLRGVGGIQNFFPVEKSE